MRSMPGMCFNWKAVAGLALVAVGLFVVAPGLALAALPLLVLAVGPLMMPTGTSHERDVAEARVAQTAAVEVRR